MCVSLLELQDFKHNLMFLINIGNSLVCGVCRTLFSLYFSAFRNVNLTLFGVTGWQLHILCLIPIKECLWQVWTKKKKMLISINLNT